jgi:DNA modification methylase
MMSRRTPLNGATEGDKPRTIYRGTRGSVILGRCETVLKDEAFRRKFQRRVKLIFTSPPFPLNQKKRYGNLQGQAYVDWLAAFAPIFEQYLTADGSVVMEIGNAWERGSPTQSILPYEALLGFLRAGEYKLCQEITYYNPAKLPTPAQWVTVERIRLKDATSKLWWMSRVTKPDADNRRVLTPYSKSMQRLLTRGKYNAGRRPSEHKISENGFLKDNDGSIAPNLIQVSNTANDSPYQTYCRKRGIEPHPARMPAKVAEFFVEFLTKPGDLVLDPFSGSNTTGSVADSLGRRWISIEASHTYAASGIAWFSAAEADAQLGRP